MARDTPQAPPAFPSIPIGAAIDANEVSREEVIDLFGKERAEQMTREIPARSMEKPNPIAPPTTPPISAAPPQSVVVPDPSKPATSKMPRILMGIGCAMVLAFGAFAFVVTTAVVGWFVLS